MLKPLVRIFAALLEDETTGVNAKLAEMLIQVPPEDDETAPPDVLAIYDETRHDWVASGNAPTDPESYPLIAVKIQNARRLDGRATHLTRDGVYDIVFEYMTRDDEPARAKRDAYDTLRAALLAVQDLHGKNANDPARKRGMVAVSGIEDPEYVPTYDEISEGAYFAGAVMLQVTARDLLL